MGAHGSDSHPAPAPDSDHSSRLSAPTPCPRLLKGQARAIQKLDFFWGPVSVTQRAPPPPTDVSLLLPAVSGPRRAWGPLTEDLSEGQVAESPTGHAETASFTSAPRRNC